MRFHKIAYGEIERALNKKICYSSVNGLGNFLPPLGSHFYVYKMGR